MSTEKIAITIEDKTLTRLDTLVKNRVFPSRSRLIQEAIREKLERLDRSRLARECAKLDEDFEKSLAEEDMAEELSDWPEY
ncbi:MAG: CopG family ribbon-helix-helix protein [Desulfuromonadales bacterium]